MSIIEPAVFLADARMIARELMSLRLENARLREFVEWAASFANDEPHMAPHGPEMGRAARAALQEGSDES